MKKKTSEMPTQFINVRVTAVPDPDHKTSLVKYRTTFEPAFVTVVQPDTVINYQLVDPTPEGVRFASVEITPDSTQISQPSISRSGKLVTFSDANTKRESLAVTLYFTDRDGLRFAVDPDIKNDPQPPFLFGTNVGSPPLMAFAVDPDEPNNPQPPAPV